MRRVELIVAVAGDDEGWHRLHPPGEQPEYVECRLVRPVQVLEDEDCRSARAQFMRKGCHDVVWRSALHDRLELAADRLSNGDEWPERTWREKRIAAAPEDSGRLAVHFAELPHNGRLADTRFTTDQQNLPVRAPLNGL